MTEPVDVLPELKEIVGAVLFAAKQPITAAQLRHLLKQTAEHHGAVTKDFAQATEKDVAAAIDALSAQLEQARPGVRVVQIAGGYRLENVPRCGPWLREYLEKGRPARLSQPALETLAIIAYRQPCVRSEIEAVRGVAVDQIVRNLLDLQLIKITGRSDLPGRPWLFGTTQKFLEHFGLRNLDDLPGVEELQRFQAAAGRDEASAAEAPEALEHLEPPPPPFAEDARDEGGVEGSSAGGDASAGDGTGFEDGEQDEDEDDEFDDDEFDDDEFDDDDEDDDDEDEDGEDELDGDEDVGEDTDGEDRRDG